MTSICEKKVNKCLYRISSFCEHFLMWKSVPLCRDENWFYHINLSMKSVLVGQIENSSRQNGINHHLSCRINIFKIRSHSFRSFNIFDKVATVGFLATRVANNWFLCGNAKTEWKVSREDFYTILRLYHHSPGDSILTPSQPLPTHILICLLKILNFCLWENITKKTKAKYAILQMKIV